MPSIKTGESNTFQPSTEVLIPGASHTTRNISEESGFFCDLEPWSIKLVREIKYL